MPFQSSFILFEYDAFVFGLTAVDKAFAIHEKEVLILFDKYSLTLLAIFWPPYD